ncbi:MAG: DMT family transporter [Candidatus Krumholzibacteriota bacterium]|nr:DMT family transporter [Candidatus Krumholzibacteriota bacterium]
MGEVYALITAFVWAFAVILIKKSGEKIPPFALNFFRVGIASFLFLATFLIMREPLLWRAPLEDYLILTLSGAIAIVISDTLFHMCINAVGAGINALVDTLYSPSIIFFAYLLLGEKLNLWHFGGLALVISGVFLTTRVDPPAGRTRKELMFGIFWGVLAMLTLGVGIVIAKPVLERSPVLWATAVRQIGAFLVMIPAALVMPSRKRIFLVFKPEKHWKYMFPATFLGSYVALIFWIAGMKYTQTGIAAILNQTSSIHILILASVFLKEPFSRNKLVAAVLALSGIILVTLG